MAGSPKGVGITGLPLRVVGFWISGAYVLECLSQNSRLSRLSSTFGLQNSSWHTFRQFLTELKSIGSVVHFGRNYEN